MSTTEYLLRLLKYDDWANHEALNSIKGTRLHRSRKLLAHIISAEHEWFNRLSGEPQQLAIWPEWSFEECEAQLGEIASAWRNYLSEAGDDRLKQKISYTNSKGEVFEGTVHDIVMHVVIHSSYHRGQIATDQRLDGSAPPFTDFVHCIRKGFID